MLRLFAQTDFDTLSSWVTSEQLLFQFSANTFPYPLQYHHLDNYSKEYPERQFYIAYSAELGNYGFGEIIPQPGNVPRLGRLLIGEPALRGKGLGSKLVLLLLDECRQKYTAPGVELFVLTDNLAAIKCYQNIGFYFLDEELQLVLNDGVKTMKKMRIDF